MTCYHPVTEEELDQIKNDCLHPDKPSCDGCKCAEGIDFTRASHVGCTFKGANTLMDEVVTRVDPLEVLKAWRKWLSYKMPTDTLSWAHETLFIKRLCENPQEVVKEGIKNGWWKQ